MSFFKKKIELCPVVCAVDDFYSIRVPFNGQALMSVVVGDREYFNHSNGVRRSDCFVQHFEVPMKALDQAGEYTVKCSPIIERFAYSCDKEPEIKKTFKFKPLTKTQGINIYLIADTHGIEQASIQAGTYFGEDLDLLLLLGDISSTSQTLEDTLLPFKIAYGITKGEIPCIIVKGNHDNRGKFAEKLEEILPMNNGKSYYSVRLGGLWFIALDCGEDKEDYHREYGGTAAFHGMRLDQTEFIQKVIENADTEYNAPDVQHKLALCHVPFTWKNDSECKGEQPFDIENEIYDKWTSLLGEYIKPEIMLCGHEHKTEAWRRGCEKDSRNAKFDVLIGSEPFKKENSFNGSAITIEKDRIKVVFADTNHNVIGEEIFDI